MSTPTLIIAIITYGFALWLGLYLIARDYSKAYLRYTGLGLIAYSLALLTDMLISSSSAEVPPIYLAVHNYLVFMPSILWSAALNDLLPSGNRFPSRILPLWLFVILPISVLFINLSNDQITGGFLILSVLVFLPLLIVLIKFIKVFPRARAKQTYGLLIVATLFFGLSTGLTFFPIDWLPRFWVLLAIGLDLEILAYGIAFLDAFEEGESLRGDILRSFQAAFFSALLFGGLLQRPAVWRQGRAGHLSRRRTQHRNISAAAGHHYRRHQPGNPGRPAANAVRPAGVFPLCANANRPRRPARRGPPITP